MTRDEARRAWLEAAIPREDLLRLMRQAALDHGWVLSYREAQEVADVTVPALAALLDAPLRELEEALTEIMQRGCTGAEYVAHQALARMPWKEEGR